MTFGVMESIGHNAQKSALCISTAERNNPLTQPRLWESANSVKASKTR